MNTKAEFVKKQLEALNNLNEKKTKEVIIDLTGVVICDICDVDFSNSDKQGGFLLSGATSVCPDCEPRMRKSIKKRGEESSIVAECPKGMSHKDWILSMRPPNAAMIISRGSCEKVTEKDADNPAKFNLCIKLDENDKLTVKQH